jgi:hypothetical protein
MQRRPAPRRAIVCAVAVLVGAQPGSAKEQITITRKDSRQYPPRPDDCAIAIHEEPEAKPDSSYAEVAIINYHDERHRSKDGSLKLAVVLPLLKARACRLGADALIDIRVTEVRRLEFVMFNVRATAVKFSDTPERRWSGLEGLEALPVVRSRLRREIVDEVAGGAARCDLTVGAL